MLFSIYLIVVAISNFQVQFQGKGDEEDRKWHHGKFPETNFRQRRGRESGTSKLRREEFEQNFD